MFEEVNWMQENVVADGDSVWEAGWCEGEYMNGNKKINYRWQLLVREFFFFFGVQDFHHACFRIRKPILF